MTYLPLLLSLASFGSRLRSRPIEPGGTHEDRGESSICQPPPMKRLPKVGTIPRAVGCACPACNVTTKRAP